MDSAQLVMMAPLTSRRDFLLFSAAAVSAGCAGSVPTGSLGTARTVRAPAIDQAWHYAKHDYFTGQFIDTQFDRISSVEVLRPGWSMTVRTNCKIPDGDETMPWPNYPMILRTTSAHEEGGNRDWSINTKFFSGEDGKLKKRRGDPE